jgi:hypothetical protein
VAFEPDPQGFRLAVGLVHAHPARSDSGVGRRPS